MRLFLRTSRLSLAMLALAGASSADIVVLDNGRFLGTEGFRVEGERARIELEHGGELVLPLVLAAYNAGETAVARHNGVPPFRETQEYIRRIYSFLGLAPVSEK